MCVLGTFSRHAVVSEFSLIKIDDDYPFEVAALVGCGVPTGWGAAVNTAQVQAGDVAVIYGIGGIGINSVQGARISGARVIAVVDPVAGKREAALKLGATHAFATAAHAHDTLTELTQGQGADRAIVTTGVPDTDTVRAAFEVLGKGGVLVLVGLSSMAAVNVQVPGFGLVNWEKQIRGSLFGSCNPKYDILKMLSLYEAGTLRLDELITARYRLEDVNQGYADLHAGKNIRGIIVHSHD